MVFQYCNDGTEAASTELYYHTPYYEAGNWPGSKELCSVPSFATASRCDRGQATVSSARPPSLSERGGDNPCLPGVLWDQESVVAGKNLVKMVIKGLWILQERTNRSGHLYMKLLFTPYLGQTSPQFFWSEPPTDISSGVRKHRVKQLTISRFGQMFWVEIWTKQKVYISKNWLKLNHVIYPINKTNCLYC